MSITKQNKIVPSSLVGLFFIGLIFIIVFFTGGSATLLKQNIGNWPKARAEVVSVESKIVCENPERSGVCYNIFFIKYAYSVGGKRYTSQMEQMYGTYYSPGETFGVYYKKDNPELVFVKGEIPTKLNFYLPLIVGLAIVIPIMILWKFRDNRHFPK